MTRAGAKQNEWTTSEIAYLKSAAGRITRREICRELKRPTWSVRMAAARLGLSLRCYKRTLVWCSECASWRAYINERTGRCKVCGMRERLYGREDACSDAMAAMTPQQRRVYEESEVERERRVLPQRPRRPTSQPDGLYAQGKAEEAYLRELEEWEYRCLQLDYDAVKSRLKRMREKTGTNPRKNN